MLIKNKRTVKGKMFKNHEDAGDPVNTSRIYNAQMADEIIVIDIDSTTSKKEPDFDILKKMAKNCFIPISFGGGISNLSRAFKAFESGADKIIINSKARKEPNFVSKCSKIFGKQAIVVAIDYKYENKLPIVMENNGTKKTKDNPINWAKRIVKMGAGEIFFTNVSNEGMQKGIDNNFFRIASKTLNVPTIAHGGAKDLNDFVEPFKKTNISGIAAGRILQFADNNLLKIRKYMLNSQIDTRPC